MEYSNKDLIPTSDKLSYLAGKILKDKQDYEKWLKNACKLWVKQKK